MGRLIDADIALGRFIEEAEASGKGCIHINTIKRLLQDIDTAYDVEKIVGEIKKKHCQKCRNILSVPGAEEYCKRQKCRIYEICDTVKAGGAE